MNSRNRKSSSSECIRFVKFEFLLLEQMNPSFSFLIYKSETQYTSEDPPH